MDERGLKDGRDGFNIRRVGLHTNSTNSTFVNTAAVHYSEHVIFEPRVQYYSDKGIEFSSQTQIF